MFRLPKNRGITEVEEDKSLKHSPFTSDLGLIFTPWQQKTEADT